MVARFPPPGFPPLPARGLAGVRYAEPKKHSLATRTDAEPAVEEEDTRLCAPYAADIDAYLRAMETEARRRPAPDYMSARAPVLNAGMRALLVNWIAEADRWYGLVQGTIHRAVSYVDRFLSVKAIEIENFQLLGAAALFIAAKYEDAYAVAGLPEYLTRYGYMKREVLAMERHVLAALKYEMGNPTAYTFLEHFTNRYGQEDVLLRFVTLYLGELSLTDYGCLRFLPSVVAASAVFVARLTVRPGAHPWSRELKELTGYKVLDLKDCIRAMHELQLNRPEESDMVVIREKYKCVSMLLPPRVIPALYFEDPKEYLVKLN